MSDVLLGFDASHHNRGIDLRRARGEGMEFFCARVTSGGLARDQHQNGRPPVVDELWQHHRDLGRELWTDTFSAYHRIGAAQGVQEQVDMCCRHMGDLSIPLMLDHEAGAGSIDRFLAVRDEFSARGVRCYLAYWPDWYWESFRPRPDLSRLGMSLARSEYTGRKHTATPQELYRGVQGHEWGHYGGGTTVLLQFTDSARMGGYAPVCADAFRGGRDEYVRMLDDRALRRHSWSTTEDAKD